MNYDREILRDSPLAYWRLGEGAGAEARDASPNGRHGTYAGSPALGEEGALASDSDAACRFDGVDDKLTLPVLPALGDTLTIEFWIKPASGGDAGQCLIGEADGSPTVLFKAASQKLSVFYAGADHLNGTPLAFDTWRHVAIVIAGGAGAFYIDGVPDGTFSSFPSGFAPDRIGDDTAGNTYKGCLDEVALYGSALSGERVAAHYAAAWRGLVALRARLRTELRDESAAGYRWPDSALDRHLLRACDDLSDAWPDERATTLTTTPGSRDLSLATLDHRLRIEAVEYPAGAWPPLYAQFQTWGETLTILADTEPAGAEAVRVHWGRRHELGLLTSTVPAAAEETLVLGASAYALLDQAGASINRINLSGPGAEEDFKRQGEERLRRFHAALRRHGRAGRLRSSSLYGPARREPSRFTVAWEQYL